MHIIQYLQWCLISCSYILSKSNDKETNASICGIAADYGDVFSLTGNDPSAPRLVNLTLDLMHIFSIAKPMICPSDGIWNATTNCTVSNAESCFNNATLSKSTVETNAVWCGHVSIVQLNCMSVSCYRYMLLCNSVGKVLEGLEEPLSLPNALPCLAVHSNN